MSGTQITTVPAAGWTPADVVALKQAIAASGNVQSVTYDDGKQVRYLPVAEALALLARMEDDVRVAGSAAALPGIVDPMHRPVRRFVGYMRAGY